MELGNIAVDIGSITAGTTVSSPDSVTPPWDSIDLPPGVARAALAGDPVAMSGLFGWLRPRVVRYCRARITPRPGHGGADDVAHDICVAVLHGLPTFVGEPEEILRWVYGIAAHKVIDYYRRSDRDKSDTSQDAPSQPDPSAGPEESARRGEQRATLQALLAVLTPMEREILTLRIVVGLSSADTAAVTGMSATAVRVTQHRALNRLRRHLQSSSPVNSTDQQVAPLSNCICPPKTPNSTTPL